MTDAVPNAGPWFLTPESGRGIERQPMKRGNTVTAAEQVRELIDQYEECRKLYLNLGDNGKVAVYLGVIADLTALAMDLENNH